MLGGIAKSDARSVGDTITLYRFCPRTHVKRRRWESNPRLRVLQTVGWVCRNLSRLFAITIEGLSAPIVFSSQEPQPSRNRQAIDINSLTSEVYSILKSLLVQFLASIMRPGVIAIVRAGKINDSHRTGQRGSRIRIPPSQFGPGNCR